jgi:uncharacterized protein with HEPN domain
MAPAIDPKAVSRTALAAIGEAAGRVSEARQAELPQLPRREMVGMRNLVTHD